MHLWQPDAATCVHFATKASPASVDLFRIVHAKIAMPQDTGKQLLFECVGTAEGWHAKNYSLQHPNAQTCLRQELYNIVTLHL